MVSLETVRESNLALKDYGPDLVAVFVGGTSGIGESTARAFVQHTLSPRVYLVGRNEAQASKIIDELRQVNSSGEVSFIKCDATRLRAVDEACKAIQEKEEKVNLLVLSSGILTNKGPDETDEGLDKKFSLHYYSRMRFLANLLPQLTKAGTEKPKESNSSIRPSLSSVVSVLEAGGEAHLIEDDLSLKTNYSLRNCKNHAITMTSLSMQKLAELHPHTSFVHTYPGLVRTNLLRECGMITKTALSGLMFLLKPWEVPVVETGERHLYAATSLQYPSSCDGSGAAKWSGAYLLNWDGSARGNMSVLNELNKKGAGDLVWKHTLGVFEDICG
ncbi:hypothetical protein ASPWEDRAFT_75347, partial [Aspergillus wentii DTO 134E9]